LRGSGNDVASRIAKIVEMQRCDTPRRVSRPDHPSRAHRSPKWDFGLGRSIRMQRTPPAGFDSLQGAA
jgi:hypothetical protein